jgi:mRNA interferase RelE/StbE
VTTWTVKLTDDAKADFKRLDGREKAIVAKKLMNLERDPRIGKPLGNKMGMDLTGYFKLYLEGRRLRIVYGIQQEIIKVIAIGKRDEMKVYKLAMQRIQDLRKD